MKMFLAGEREAISKSSGERRGWSTFVKRRLFSYYSHGFQDGNRVSRDVQESAALGLDLFLDSGAFSAFTKKVEINVEQYAAYVHGSRSLWTVCSSLDVIGDAAKSYDNFQALRSLGCQVQPVFHYREDNRWLAKYLDEGHDYIFLGGMVPESTRDLRKWLDRLWGNYLTHADGTPRVKVHGFGLTDQRLMFRYPWSSVDSTSWLKVGIYGACVFMRPPGLRKVYFSEESIDKDPWHYSRLQPSQQKHVDAWLERFGVTAQECAASYYYRDMVNAATYTDMEALAVDRFAMTYTTN